MDTSRVGGTPAPTRRFAPRTRLTALASTAATVFAAGIVVLQSTCGYPSAVFAAAEAEPTTTASSSPALCGQTVFALDAAVSTAALRGDIVAIGTLDRATGQYVGSSNDHELFPSASLVKLLIADDLLHQAATTGNPADPDSRATVATMLQASEDTLASALWASNGGPAIIERTVERYGLTDVTASGWDWWNTLISARDIVSYYDQLLSGVGGLDERDTELIVTALRHTHATAADGFDQEFGLWDTVRTLGSGGVKQGWMTTGYRTIRHSAGFAGEDGRYVLVQLADVDFASPSIAADVYNTEASDRATELVGAALASAVSLDGSQCGRPSTDATSVLPHTRSDAQASRLTER